MNYLVIGDVHIKLDNLPDIQILIQKINHEITIHQPHFVVLLGDILHTHERIHTSCLHYAEELFTMCSRHCPTYVLVGNHDYISNSQFLTSQHWMTPFSKWNNIYIVDRVVDFTVESYRFIACPYVPDGRMVEALQTVPDWEKAHMIFGHQTLNGVKMGAVVAEQVEDWLPHYPLLCSGHIHDKQRVQPNLYYTGTPMQQAFGESHHKTILHCTWTNQTLLQKEIALKVAIKRIEYITVQQAYSYQLQVEPYEMVRLTIKGSKEECSVFKKTPAFKSLSLLAKIVFDELVTGKEHTEEVMSTFHEVLYKNIHSNFFLTKLYKQYASLPNTTDVQFM